MYLSTASVRGSIIGENIIPDSTPENQVDISAPRTSTRIPKTNYDFISLDPAGDSTEASQQSVAMPGTSP